MPEEEKKEDPPAAEAPAEDVAEVEEAAVEVEELAEEAVCEMAEDEFYPDDHVEKPKVDSAISRRSMQFYDCFG